MSNKYQDNIKKRSKMRFLKGLAGRLPRHIYFSYCRYLARRKGAKVGDSSTVSGDFSRLLDAKVTIGNHTSINHGCSITANLYPLIIGDNVIIGNDVKFITSTHDINSTEWTHMQKGGLEIEDYVWIAPHAIIGPSVRKIGRGAVIGCGSVVTKDVEPMMIVAGNPARVIGRRSEVHSDLVVESLLGGDFRTYWNARKEK